LNVASTYVAETTVHESDLTPWNRTSQLLPVLYVSKLVPVKVTTSYAVLSAIEVKVGVDTVAKVEYEQSAVIVVVAPPPQTTHIVAAVKSSSSFAVTRQAAAS
jgi:hypothetical protein